MKINDVTKKSQGDESSVSRERIINNENMMFEMPDDEQCPYTSFIMYLEKLNEDYKFFWQ